MPKRLIVLYGLGAFLLALTVAGVFFESISTIKLIAFGLVLAVLAVVFLAFATRRLSRRLRDLANSVRQITAGHYGREITNIGAGEFGELARAFNAMSARLAEEFATSEQEKLQLRAILGGMIEGVVAIDAQQRLLFANERGSGLLEFNSPTAIGLRFWEIVRQRPIVSIVEQALDKGESMHREIDWKGNPNKSLAVHVSPLREKPGGAIIVVHDTSELRRLERLRHEFVANVSHELKTPLAVIKASIETLQGGAVDDVDHRGTFMEQIHEQTERLNNLILDLLSLARIESGSKQMVYTLIVVSELVEECLERQRSRAAARRQVLEMIPPAERSSRELRADEEALGQILDNLLDNALKYTNEGSTIRVRWYGCGDQICIEVEDDGPGIPEEDLPRIFERFYRVDKARSRELGGTGLGLAIVKNLAQIMKGSVKVSSQIGKGTTFTVCLPRAPTA